VSDRHATKHFLEEDPLSDAEVASRRQHSEGDWARMRERLALFTGKQYWRGLEELADDERFREFLDHEFPRQAAVWAEHVDRRQFLKLMGASLALAGAGACTRQPTEKVVPYVRAPEQIVPGEPLFFATATSLAGVGTGVLVESHMGRPTKVEGNPEHPASLGASDAFAQAAVLELYDPDRSHVVTNAGDIRPWAAFLDVMRRALEAQHERRGAGLRLLTETVTSPTLAQQLRDLLARFPQAGWHQYEPTGRDGSRAGTRLAFGQAVETRYHVDRADVLLALDADFLACGPGNLRHAREFGRRRRADRSDGEMNRLYVVECTPSVTGAAADHRLPLRAREVETFARAVAAALGLPVRAPRGLGAHRAWIDAVANDLRKHRGSSLVIAGEHQPGSVHALALALNQALGNVGRTLTHTAPIEAEPIDQTASLSKLVSEMENDEVEVLLILGGNPAYNAPVDLRFADRIAKVPLRVHLSLYDDETSRLCHWHVPEAHLLESWSDVRGPDGTVTIIQPLIAPLYEGKTVHELLGALSERPERSGYEIVREHWRQRWSESRATASDSDFEDFWRRALHDGVVAGSALPERPVALRSDWMRRLPDPEVADGLEIVFRPDSTVHDGRFANNGWLQELPKAITRLTWDNAALISPATAERLGLQNEQVVELRYRGRSVHAPVWITPGQAGDCVTIQLGYGRTRAGRVGTGAGFDAYALRTADAPWFGSGLEIRATGERHALACTQVHHSMEGRLLVRSVTLAQYRAHPEIVHQMEHELPPASMYPPHPYDGYAWGMAIDLGSCIGCNACVVACQAENNIPVVGKAEVARGHEMQWLRIDRYYEGALDDPVIHHQPVPCMHCENAPCEVVCPVNATVHSSEGLNDMVYNRCVGTKYCSNNCPYKVRRFNWFLYSNQNEETLKMLANPDVTVRSRGVMEKCTYCVQRINYARIRAKKEDRSIRDGEIVTACQQVCPTEAIVFGDLNDPESRVSRRKAEARNYALLASLDTRPRTTYLARLRNPNPELEIG
jgi:MoCo/4Fe-4S cofactor protein with predicted Tat translocation signal